MAAIDAGAVETAEDGATGADAVVVAAGGICVGSTDAASVDLTGAGVTAAGGGIAGSGADAAVVAADGADTGGAATATEEVEVSIDLVAVGATEAEIGATAVGIGPFKLKISGANGTTSAETTGGGTATGGTTTGETTMDADTVAIVLLLHLKLSFTQLVAPLHVKHEVFEGHVPSGLALEQVKLANL